MFRLIRLAVVAVLALFLVLVAVANRDVVAVQLVPDALGGIGQLSVDVPLFLLMIVLGGGGFALGFSWEYLREWRMRSEGRKHRKAAQSLEREMKALKADQGVDEDEVLALLK